MGSVNSKTPWFDKVPTSQGLSALCPSHFNASFRSPKPKTQAYVTCPKPSASARSDLARKSFTNCGIIKERCRLRTSGLDVEAD